jgi:hypothetical protein
MKNLDPKSVLVGALMLSTTLLLSSAVQDTKPNPDPMQEALKALTAAQERQAVAWETLANKGWPTPQNISNSFAGGVNFPSNLNVNLTNPFNDYVNVKLSGAVTTN